MISSHLFLYLLAIEGAIIAQSKHFVVLEKNADCDRCQNDGVNVASYESLPSSQIPGKEKNQIVSHVTAVINATDVDNATTCSTWFYPKSLSNGSTVCECGNDVGEMITCDSTSHMVKLLRCYCMTYSIDNSSLVVGASAYGCHYLPPDINTCHDDPRYVIPLNPSDLNQHCKKYNRDGQLCGQCRKGFATPAYSYVMHCVNCTNNTNNWTKYMIVTFLPLTVFFAIVIIFRVRVISGQLNMLILGSQALSAPIVMRTLTDHLQHPLPEYIIFSFYGIWNLDFFRLLYSPFCLHPEMTTVQALALDYAIAVYPLVLIATTYLLVELHDHGFRVIVWLWKPFHRCFVHFRRGWNIKASLIDAFATFLLLSYVKFFSVSFDLLVPTRVYNIHGKSLAKLYLFYDGSLEYFGEDHLPYGVLALVVLVVFNIFPLLLLCIYPCRCFQRCLNHCRLRSQLLYSFMDAFQGYYKDGTNGTRDCRWFSALYLIVRLSFMIAFSAINNSDFWPSIGIFILLVVLLLTAILRPYKSPTDTNIDIFLLIAFILSFVILIVQRMAYSKMQFIGLTTFVSSIVGIIPLVYWIGIVVYQLLSSIRCVRATVQKIWTSISCHRHEEEPALEDVFPYRMVHDEEYAPLLGEARQDHSVSRAIVEQSNELDQ